MVGRYCSLVQLMVVCSLVELLVSSRLDTFEAGEKFRNVRAQPWYVFVFAVLIQNKIVHAETSEHSPGMCSPVKFNEGSEERGSTRACKFP